MPESVPVLDFGSQTAQLIVRRVRELGVYSELLPHDVAEATVRALNPYGVILSGGPASVYEPDAPMLPDWLITTDLPCWGFAMVCSCKAMHWVGVWYVLPDVNMARQCWR